MFFPLHPSDFLTMRFLLLLMADAIMASPPPVLHMQLPLRPATAVTTTTSSPLLALPPELRNRIHEYAVCSPEEIVVG